MMTRTMKTLILVPCLVGFPLLLTGQQSCGDDDFDGYVFAENPAEDYARVDRMGMPAIATAVITSKDAYNRANPVDDAAGTFVSEIVSNVTALHSALDDDLTGAGLAPCVVDTCIANAAPLVIPDTIKINTTQAPGFPNGRRLQDQVIDVTLAVVLLDLGNATGCGGGPCTATTLASIPLNPPANDAVFNTVFPYMAPPWMTP